MPKNDDLARWQQEQDDLVQREADEELSGFFLQQLLQTELERQKIITSDDYIEIRQDETGILSAVLIKSAASDEQNTPPETSSLWNPPPNGPRSIIWYTPTAVVRSASYSSVVNYNGNNEAALINGILNISLHRQEDRVFAKLQAIDDGSNVDIHVSFQLRGQVAISHIIDDIKLHEVPIVTLTNKKLHSPIDMLIRISGYGENEEYYISISIEKSNG